MKKTKQTKKVGTLHYDKSKDKRVIVNVFFAYFENDNIETMEIPMILDTGANVTVLNIKFAEKIGFKFNPKKTKKVILETGTTKTQEAYAYKVPEVILKEGDKTFLISRENLEILTYDIPVEFTEFGGYFGLDFFEDKKICLDLLNGTLDVT